MRTLRPTHIAVSVVLALTAVTASAQNRVSNAPRNTGTVSTGTSTTGSSATASNPGAIIAPGTGVGTNNVTTRTTSGDLAVRATAPSAATSNNSSNNRTFVDTSTNTTSNGSTTTTRVTNSDGSSTFTDSTRTLRPNESLDATNGTNTTRVTNPDGSSTFVDSAGSATTNNSGNANANSATGNGISPGQTSSGTAAGASSGGVTGRDASLTQNGRNGFANSNGQSPGQTSSGVNGSGNTAGVATNGAIIPPGGFLAGTAGAPVFAPDNSNMNNSGASASSGMSAPSVDGGNMMSNMGNGNMGNGGMGMASGFAAGSAGNTVLDQDARREAARTRAKVSRGGQLMYSVAPRTNVDRTWQMPDDQTPLMPR